MAGAQLLAQAFGFPFWECPSQAAVAFPCPGCGLTRASVALLHGDWGHALYMHAGAPVLLLCLTLVFLAAVLPAASRERMSSRIAAIESKTGVSTLVGGALLLYYLARLISDPHGLQALVAS
ncbi:MAG: hypothetical protein ACI9VR_002016 [Cognaticolwellia sp.]|jgi:hypothetical protein